MTVKDLSETSPLLHLFDFRLCVARAAATPEAEMDGQLGPWPRPGPSADWRGSIQKASIWASPLE